MIEIIDIMIEKNMDIIQTPIITIGLPVYNDVDFIEESLISILNQTISEFKLIISDDGSTDGSEAICLKYAEKDNRIKYIRQPKNIGISKNMEFLLKQATTKYFMWAGDDDLLHPQFIEKLIQAHQNNNIVSAFGTCAFIDENGCKIGNNIDFNYSNPNQNKRLKFFIKHASDYFGYGIFITEEIRNVEFPIWWYPNNKCAYNNIYPTLCYYLAKGNYSHVYSDEPLMLKRQKTEQKTNHLITYSGNGIKETYAFIIRRFNLVVFSSKMICKASNSGIAFRHFFALSYYWFIVSSCQQLKLLFNVFIRKMIRSV